MNMAAGKLILVRRFSLVGFGRTFVVVAEKPAPRIRLQIVSSNMESASQRQIRSLLRGTLDSNSTWLQFGAP